ncbi:hypothetical protein SteCoe_16166 [Stentor coeruleus]|uniref:PUM-HD domain-containing protein n=1 Tax=Stentor coeruleus TaxID=5963 RepID=A0A1R2C202_9CILI|nr:hypothetical protein SteCoe_16166 [Stentor coeruleus]
MLERKLIGNILLEDEDSEEESLMRYSKTKRHVLLNKDELTQLLERSTSAPADIAPYPQLFSPKEPQYSNFSVTETFKPIQIPNLNTAAPEFIPSVRSPTENKRSELVEVRGRIAELARDQAGSRFLQQKYEYASAEDKQMVYEEILESSLGLIVDVFGNYVVQKVFEYGTKEHKRAIAHQMTGKIVELSLHTYGCRVLQKVLDSVDMDQKRLIALEFHGNVEKAVEDQNGNHVIQKCIEILPYNCISFIVEALKMNTVYWAEHQYGCRVIQRIIEYCPRDNIQLVFDLIIRNSVEISMKNYGNYVIQHILDKGGRQEKEELINSFRTKLFELSKHKFASNVIEKCFVVGSPEQVNAFAVEIFDSPRVSELMTDKFANFVIQKALEVSEGKLQAFLISKVSEKASSIRGYQYGKHVLNCLEKIKSIKTKSSL